VRLYWSGHLALDDGLLRGFYKSADNRARVEVLKHMGFCFLHTKEALPEVVRRQAQLLWEHRIASAQANPSSDAAAEVAEFGWWFASAKFDTTWSLRQLDSALNLTERLELDFAVAERLGTLAETIPIEAMQLLAKLMARATDWSIIGCRRGIEAAVRAAMASQKPEAQSSARELVSRLAARGHESFVQLLHP
jgi:hypothetical protein